MKRNAVCRAIKELESKNLISLKKETSKTTSYCIEKDFLKWQAVPKKRRLKIENPEIENPEIENLLVPKLGHTKKRFKEIKPSCQKPKITSTSDSPAFDFITGIFSNLESHLNRWEEAYPAICVEAEIKKAAAWLIANPKNRKSNYARFLNLWLSKAQDRAPRQQQSQTLPSSDPATHITPAQSAGIRQVFERRQANA
jgi:DNA-binding transcriptional regulator GbsR (MarR family)